MRARVTFTLISGSFEQGFIVTLKIESDELGIEQVIGSLPPAHHLLQLLEQWQLEYNKIVLPSLRVKPKPVQVTNISYSQMSNELEISLNEWLNSNSEGWQKIRDRLQQRLRRTDEILMIIQTDNLQLQKLPWHLWDLITEYYIKAEIVLSKLENKPLRNKILTSKKRVKILAILGNSTGISVEKDRLILEKLPGADVKFLVEPKRQDLDQKLWEQQWDILYFAGHSSSQDGHTGQIDINQTDSLSLPELKYALRKAIDRGLQLAIFNSCDGLGLARELSDLDIPSVIVMREPVPDLVAQEFLLHFLKTFAAGESLYLTVREARERLQSLEDKFPFATWLPVIFQHPNTIALTWQQLCGHSVNRSRRSVVSFATLVTFLIVGMRFLGWLQPQELWAFDYLMRMRPLNEGKDPRILIVGITEKDFQLSEMQSRQGSLPDPALARLLQKLEQYHPIVVGLDIFRDFPVNPKQTDLIRRMQHDDRFYAICKVSEPPEPAVAPPPEVPKNRLGFSDFVTALSGFSDSDKDLGIIRRHLIALKPSPTSPCNAESALSTQLVARYFQTKGTTVKYNKTAQLQIGSVVFPQWRSHMGGYQQLDDRGYQILLNYRSNKSLSEVAEMVTLEEVLRDRIKTPDMLKNKIVIIGSVSNVSVKNKHNTPYGTAPGVIIHAHMISQMLSAVENGRPLLWVLPFKSEALWIWAWSMVGGVFMWYVRRISYLAVLSAIALGVLYGLSLYLLSVYGVWLPVVPTTLALISTGAIVAVYQPFLIPILCRYALIRPPYNSPQVRGNAEGGG